MRTVAQWLWRLMPEARRHRIYKALLETDHPVFRALRAIVNFRRWVTLLAHRQNARVFWPDARGLDNLVLAVWLASLKNHDQMLRFTWKYGHLLRRFRAIRTSDVTNRTIVHATSSFDLGGTQTQIKYLCTAPSASFVHVATEIFPEKNFLYRRGVALEPNQYVSGSVVSRGIGRLVRKLSFRSTPIVQIYKLFRDFERERPAAVVGWGHEMSVTTFIAAAMARVPHIVFCIRTVNPAYGWVPEAWGRMLLQSHQRMLPSVSLVAVNSTLLRDDHARWVGMDPAAIAVCANGIELTPATAGQRAVARARVRAELGIAGDATVITNVGRFSGEKGQHSLVDANRLLLARGTASNFVWVLWGDGPLLAEVQAKAAGLGATNMLFPGRTNAVREILFASDIFVMPSDFEGMPNAMLEAMAAGLPCVSTIRSGALDVARDGREALYYEARDAVTLAQHLDRLLTNPDDARALGQAAAARAAEFPIERLVRTFEAAIAGILAAPAAAK